MASGDEGLSVLNSACSGSGSGFCGSIAGDRAGLSPGLGVVSPARGMEVLETLREWVGEGFRGTVNGTAPSIAVETGRDTGVLLSLGSSAMAGVLPRPETSLFFSADVAELGTRLIIGLIPAVLSVLLRETRESESLDMGVGGIDL